MLRSHSSWRKRSSFSQLGPPLRAVDLNSSAEESLQEEDAIDGLSLPEPSLPFPPNLRHKENQTPLSLCDMKCVSVERKPPEVAMETPAYTTDEAPRSCFKEGCTPAMTFPEPRPPPPPSSSHTPHHKEVLTSAMIFPEPRPPPPPSSSHTPHHKEVLTSAMTFPESRPPFLPSGSHAPHHKERLTPAMTFPKSRPPLPPSSNLTPHYKVHTTPCPQRGTRDSPEQEEVGPSGAPNGSISKYLNRGQSQGGVCTVGNCRGPPVPERVPPFSLEPESDVIVMRSQNGERRFKRLAMVGQGGSSKVYKVIGEDWQMYALKEVYLKHVDPAVKSAYVNEIRLLSRLRDKPEIITLHDYTWDKQEGTLYLLLAYAETDLNTVIRQQSSQSLASALYFWNEMLQVVKVIHNEGIIHNDLKPENFVCIGARLKLIDFGIANRIETEKTSIERDIRCGTINYMAPETIATHEDKDYFKVGRPSDVWSLGCILYRMVYGRTPFEHIRNKMKKWLAITDPSVSIAFPEVGNRAARDIMQKCLRRPPKERPTVDQLMAHPFSCLQEMPA